MARYQTVNEIINQAAIEAGLMPSNDPVGDVDEAFVQMRGLLNGVGQELIELNDWQILVKTFAFTTADGDTGIYPLPSDFSHMIDQTGWDRTNRVMVGGPLSAQDWTYLQGRDLVSQTIYASFRQLEGELYIFPQPPPEGLQISFEYISRDWLKEADSDETRDNIGAGSNICLLHPQMVTKMLKMKWLQAKGFDASSASIEFETIFGGQIGKDVGAAVLSASNSGRLFPYLDPYRNTGDTGFGR
jgi:hypothetical protein